MAAMATVIGSVFLFALIIGYAISQLPPEPFGDIRDDQQIEQ